MDRERTERPVDEPAASDPLPLLAARLPLDDRTASTDDGDLIDADDDAPRPVFPTELPRIAGYEVRCLLGRGRSSVYRARREHDGRPVAVKVLPIEGAGSVKLARFVREARALVSVEHPQIVQALDFGREGDRFWLAMEMLEGETLEERVAATGPLAERPALGIARDILRALAALAAGGLVHRDVKPSNIQLVEGRGAVLLDLGLVVGSDGLLDGRATAPGVFVGTPQYVAPEQAEGAPDIDGRADIYSLGLTLYHALTATVPFADSSVLGVLSSRLTKELPSVRSAGAHVSPVTARIVDRMTARHPADRPATAVDALREVEAVLAAGETVHRDPTETRRHERAAPAVSAGTDRPPRRSGGSDRRRPVRGAAAPVIALALASGLLGASILLATLSLSSRQLASAEAAARSTTLALPTADGSADLPARIRWNADGAEMVLVRAGRFSRGSLVAADERPAHQVWLSAFYVDVHEVTRERWARFLASPPAARHAGCDLGEADHDGHVPVGWDDFEAPMPSLPVGGIRFADALAYAAWAGKRLPTEAQWEKVARGPLDERSYPWGHSPLPWASFHPPLLNFRSTPRRGAPERDGFLRLAPVGSFPAGAAPSGALDTAGNVAEWVLDDYAADAYRRQLAGRVVVRDPVVFGGATRGTGIVRGGSFHHPPRRLTARTPLDRRLRLAWVGLRCAIPASEVSAEDYSVAP